MAIRLPHQNTQHQAYCQAGQKGLSTLTLLLTPPEGCCPTSFLSAWCKRIRFLRELCGCPLIYVPPASAHAVCLGACAARVLWGCVSADRRTQDARLQHCYASCGVLQLTLQLGIGQSSVCLVGDCSKLKG